MALPREMSSLRKLSAAIETSKFRGELDRNGQHVVGLSTFTALSALGIHMILLDCQVAGWDVSACIEVIDTEFVVVLDVPDFLTIAPKCAF